MSDSARPTLRQVAEAAGVSVTTASRVMRGDAKVASATREKVQAAARRLGFHVNTLASALRQASSSRLVGVVLPDVSDPFFAAFALGFENTAAENGRGMVLACHREDKTRERWLLEMMMSNRLSALVIVPAGTDYGYLAQEMALGTPVVLVDRPGVGIAADTVLTNNREGMGLLVGKLVADGHRRIALITEDQQIWTQRERIDGYRAELVASGIELDDSLVRSIPTASGDIDIVVETLLDSRRPPTAIVCTHVPLVIGALQVADRRRSDVVLASFDDHPLFRLLSRAVTVVRQDPERLGRCAAELALARLAGDTRAPQRLVLPVHLVDAPATSLPSGSRSTAGSRA